MLLRQLLLLLLRSMRMLLLRRLRDLPAVEGLNGHLVVLRLAIDGLEVLDRLVVGRVVGVQGGVSHARRRMI